jgi:F0F1-type ATP synthase membrane subunit b/b'
VVAVPSAVDGLTGEVAFLFDDLDRIESDAAQALAAARSEAAVIDGAAREERPRLLQDARVVAERAAADGVARRTFPE